MPFRARFLDFFHDIRHPGSRKDGTSVPLMDLTRGISDTEPTGPISETDPTGPISAFCPPCRTMFERFWQQEKSVGPPIYHGHHKTFRSVFKWGASQKCLVCTLLVRPLLKELGESDTNLIPNLLRSRENSRVLLPDCTKWYWRGSTPFGVVGYVVFYVEWLEQALPYELNGFNWSENGVRFLALPVPRKPDNGLDHVKSKHVSPSQVLEMLEQPLGKGSGSVETFNIIRAWMNDCEQGHRLCSARTKTSWLPTRLLDLGSSEDLEFVRVCATSEQQFTSVPQYATLTHRWPTDPTSQLKLTTENMEELKNNVPLTSLTETFKDAMEISKRMGINYLWIDSLCIIQNDTADWEQEAATMAKVYGLGTINISACAASDGSRGCFRTRDPSVIQLPLTTKPAGRQTLEKPHVMLPFKYWDVNIEDTEIQTRGWILQERVLSPRTLHFAADQVFWECRELYACESVPFGIPNELTTRMGFETPNLKAFTAGLIRTNYSSTVRSHLWTKVVTMFSPLNFTFTADRLAALAGIASEVQRITESEYLAGLWKSHLPEALLWRFHESDNPHPHRLPGIAPSWSWASVQGPVECFQQQAELQTMSSVVDFLETHITPANPSNPFGAVKDAFLRVRGRLSWVEWTWESTEGSERDESDSQGERTSISLPDASSICLSSRLTNDIFRSAVCDSKSEDPIVDWPNIVASVDIDIPNLEEAQEGFFLPLMPRGGESALEGLLLSEQMDGSFVRRGLMTVVYDGLLYASDREEFLSNFQEVEMVLK